MTVPADMNVCRVMKIFMTPLMVVMTLSACTNDNPKQILEKETQRCEQQLSAVIDSGLFSGLGERGIDGRAMMLAARIEMEPSRREPIGDNIRLIVTKFSCIAYDSSGNALGKYTMALSNDNLYWWVRTDHGSELHLTKRGQDFDKKGIPLKASPRLRLTINSGKQIIEITRGVDSGDETTQTFATFEDSPEFESLKITTRNRILKFGDDGRLKQSVYCYEFDGPYCENSNTWDYHNFKYNEAGLVIDESGISEGEDYHYKRDFELNKNGDIIREGGMTVNEDNDVWKWGEYRRILYHD